MSATFHIQCSVNVMMKSFDKGWDHQLNLPKLAAAMQENAKTFEQRSWALIDDIRGWPIRLPEQISLSQKVSATMRTMGMTHCAVCVEDIAVSRWMMKKIVAKGVKLAFFNTLEECQLWLEKQGFDVQFGEPAKPEVMV